MADPYRSIGFLRSFDVIPACSHRIACLTPSEPRPAFGLAPFAEKLILGYFKDGLGTVIFRTLLISGKIIRECEIMIIVGFIAVLLLPVNRNRVSRVATRCPFGWRRYDAPRVEFDQLKKGESDILAENPAGGMPRPVFPLFRPIVSFADL